jgi:hypothetical protein
MPRKQNSCVSFILKVIDFDIFYHANRDSCKFAEKKGLMSVTKGIKAICELEYSDSKKIKDVEKLEIYIFPEENDQAVSKIENFYPMGSIQKNKEFINFTFFVPEKDYDGVCNSFDFGRAKFISLSSLELVRNKAIIINASINKKSNIDEFI